MGVDLPPQFALACVSVQLKRKRASWHVNRAYELSREPFRGADEDATPDFQAAMAHCIAARDAYAGAAATLDEAFRLMRDRVVG